MSDYKYPMWFKCISNHDDNGMIVKFTSLKEGDLVQEAKNGCHKIGKTSHYWIRHDDKSVWEDVTDEYKKSIPPMEDLTISDIQKERGSVYGKFSKQAECVGNIIGACMTASKQGGELMSMGSKEIGAVAYIAIKLARYAVSPTHADTLIDLESYCNLIKKMEIGDVKEHT